MGILSELKGNASKKPVLKSILLQQETLEKDNLALCDLLSQQTGKNFHKTEYRDVPDTAKTIIMVLKLRGGMFDETSGRRGMDHLAEHTTSKTSLRAAVEATKIEEREIELRILATT